MFAKLWNRADYKHGERISDKIIRAGLQKAGIDHFFPSEAVVCHLPHLPS